MHRFSHLVFFLFLFLFHCSRKASFLLAWLLSGLPVNAGVVPATKGKSRLVRRNPPIFLSIAQCFGCERTKLSSNWYLSYKALPNGRHQTLAPTQTGRRSSATTLPPTRIPPPVLLPRNDDVEPRHRGGRAAAPAASTAPALATCSRPLVIHVIGVGVVIVAAAMALVVPGLFVTGA